MRELLAVLALSLALASAPTVIDWETTPPASGSVEAGSAVVAGPGTHLLVVIDRPDVSGPWFELSGQVSYTEAQNLRTWRCGVTSPTGRRSSRARWPRTGR